jgi:ABC-type spermidine/putrescine transport system permease subunit I
MNPKRLVKHFPELAELPQAEQYALLDKAYKDAFNQADKMKNWRTNVITAVLMTSVCFLCAWALPKILPISPQASAWFLMLVVLPVLFVIQHRRFIHQLRTSLQKILP